MMTPLQVLLLGTPEIYENQKIIHIPRRIPRILLFYLASRGRMVNRAEIIRHFWNNSAEESARLRLNESISRLKKVIGDPNIIITEGQFIGLDLDQVYVDQRDFESLLDQIGKIPWHIPENTPLSDSVYRSLKKAVSLWHGTKFLENITLPNTTHIDNWHYQTGAQLENRRKEILQRLSAHDYAVGDVEQALVHAQAGLANDALDETLQHQVMTCLIGLGRNNEAAHYFKNMQKLFQNELDLNPPAKLVALYHQIRTPKSGSHEIKPPKWEVHASINLPFFGREQISRQIITRIQQNKGIIIQGESGQGKTRLMQEIAAQLTPQRRILVTTCRPLETTLPFQPLREIFRQYIEPDEWLSLPRIWASQLASITPELKTMRSDIRSRDIRQSQETIYSQNEIFEAIQQLFQMLAQKHRLLLVVDDAQWADEATLAALAFLMARQPFTNRGTIAVLMRIENQSDPLNEFTAKTHAAKLTEIFQLEQLNRQEISHICNFILETPPPTEFIRNIKNSTGGNPLFLLETLRNLIDHQPTNEIYQIDKFPLAASLQKIIRQRIHGFGQLPRTILETGAILGSNFTSREISQIAEVNENQVILNLEYLEEKRILQSETTHSGLITYRFIHDKFREGVAADIPGGRASRLHHNAANLIRENPLQAAVAAYHFENSGNLPQAFELWFEAGQQARKLFAITDASRAFSNAKKIADLIDNQLSDQQIYQLYTTWSEIAYETQKTGLVRNLGNDLLAMGQKRQNPKLIGAAYDTLSDACMTENQYEAGLAFSNKAIHYLDQSQNTFEKVEAYVHRGVFLYMLNRFEEAIQSFEDALVFSVNSPDPNVTGARSNAHYQLALVYTLMASPERGREHAMRSLQDAETSQRVYLQFSAYFVLTLSSFYLGEFHKAKNYAETGIKLARKAEGWRMLGYLLGYAAPIEITLGHFDQAFLYAQEGIQIGETYKLPDIFALGCRNLGDIYMLLQDHQAAIVLFEKAYQAAGEHFTGVDNLIRMGYIFTVTDQKELGFQILENALDTFDAIQLELGSLTTQFFQSKAYIKHQQYAQARKVATRLHDRANRRGMSAYYLNALQNLGISAFYQGDIDQAIEALTTAAEEARLIGNIWTEIEALNTLKNMPAATTYLADSSTNRLEQIRQNLHQHCQNPELQLQLHALPFFSN